MGGVSRVSDTDTLSGVWAVTSFFGSGNSNANHCKTKHILAVLLQGGSCRKRGECVIPEYLEGRKNGSWAISEKDDRR